MRDYLDFEKPLRDLEERIEKLAGTGTLRPGVQEEIRKLKAKLAQTELALYKSLTPWQRTQIARHPQRPSFLDYVNAICQDFIELHGDRAFADDQAIVGGFARLQGRSVLVVGHQKGKTLKDRVQRNFGMPNPEGYRKALRLMRLADKFGRPIVSFIDTPGAYPGIGAEERGQAEAIARNLLEMAQLAVPTLAVIIGEGGSGGALALGVADQVLMLEHSIYSVISPEGCAAILWDDPTKAAEAASALKMTAPDLLELGIIDEIVPEPLGGAHREPPVVMERVAKALAARLTQLIDVPAPELISRRESRYRKIGHTASSPSP
jgi:acetyl-CoA carboxylase carboxyl transferase subunit alpha